ncbi:MAG: peptide chain release factor 1 [Nanoarchaeota archaeon]|nr:MAG: peptide chain release factor 1 [Nanoarchaeota archaeon]
MEQVTAQERHKLKKFISELETYRGRHTELVSVYVPQGYEMTKIINHLSEEQGTASNIKSSSTRNNVTDALERMIQHLRLYTRTPENGLAAFSGNVAEREGQSDVKVWSIEPPVPLKIRLYRCDKEFVLEPLRDMLQDKEIYALIVMDRREGNIAILRGKSLTPILKTTSNVPGKTRAGGQSSQRFERIREGAAKEFYSKLGDYMTQELLHNKELKGIIIGGPGPTKYDFVSGNYITGDLKKKILGIKDITYTGDFGLNELLDKSQDILAEASVTKEKKLVTQFLEMLAKTPNKVNYGQKNVMDNLKNGVVDMLLLSEELDEKLIEQFEEEAKKFGTKVEIISTQTREGAQLRDIGGIAAILRYEVHQE